MSDREHDEGMFAFNPNARVSSLVLENALSQ